MLFIFYFKYLEIHLKNQIHISKNSQIYELKSKHTQNFCSADFR